MKIATLLIVIIFFRCINAQPDWTIMPSGTTKNINDIWGTSPSNIYAVGDSGLILHYDGVLWNKITTSITSNLVSMMGFSANEIYVLGNSNADTLFKYDGNSWSVFAASPSISYFNNVIWGTSGTNLYIGGGSGGAPHLNHYNGVEWETEVSFWGFTILHAIHGVSTTEVYTGGSGGKIVHYSNCNQTGNYFWDGLGWVTGNVSGLWVAGNNDAFASTEYGVFRFTGQFQSICNEIWNQILQTESNGPLFGIWGFSNNKVYAYGEKLRFIQPNSFRGSLIYQYDGQNWTEMTTQTDFVHERGINALWGSDIECVFAVGENGVILKLGGEINDTLVVNKITDEADVNPGDGLCDIGGLLINGRTPCSLRAALMESNSNNVDNLITFDIPGSSPHVIIPSSKLPEISDRVIIEGNKVSFGDNFAPAINLDGQNAGNNADGISITANGHGSKILNMAIYNFHGDGIYINASSEIVIKGCYIGTDYNGNENLGNGGNGINISKSTFNKVGGNTDEEINVISGNGKNGINIYATYGNYSLYNKVLNNIIGLKPNGLEKLSNTLSGIHIEFASNNTIGGDFISNTVGDFNTDGNIISGNLSRGISLNYTRENKIYGNIIGLNKNGDSLGYLQTGIYMSRANNNVIGGTDRSVLFGFNPQRNIISGNIDGIAISSGSQNIVKGNRIIKNQSDGILIYDSDRNTIGGTVLGSENVISGNEHGVLISGDYYNVIINNIIGSENLSIEEGGNEIGIIIHNTKNTKIGGVETILPPEFTLFDTMGFYASNKIYNNGTGIQIQYHSPESNLEIVKNDIRKNVVGIRIISSEIININGNLISLNDTGVIGYDSRLLFKNDLFYLNLSPNSSIHLYNSHAIIKNNLITVDAGDAIKLENGSTADINFNNIFDNSGFGVNNTTPSEITNAQSNWWGDPNGPGGQGPGNGDPVSSGVDYSNWLPELLAVTVTASVDTIFTPLGNYDTTNVYVGNWLNPDDTLNISLNDDLNWLQGPTNYAVYLNSVFGVSTKVIFQVPGSATPGTTDLVEVTAVSQSNPSHSQTDSFYIEAYQPVVNTIFVLPDTITIAAEDSVQFLAEGFDQHNRSILFTPQWSATGGTINSDGWFYGGNQLGTFEVTATDPSSQAQGTATVIISTLVGVKEELANIPTEYNLYQNYPNPFNPFTTIRYAIPFTSEVTISVYNILGERVEKLISEIKNPGIYEMNWNASKLASSVYIYVLQAKSVESDKIYRNVKKMILLK